MEGEHSRRRQRACAKALGGSFLRNFKVREAERKGELEAVIRILRGLWYRVGFNKTMWGHFTSC